MVERTPFADCEALRLARNDSRAPGSDRTLLIPFDRPRTIQRTPSVAILRPRRWLHAMRRAAVGAHPAGGLTAAAASAVDLLPYQLEPALAMVRMGVARVMIADAVGLGKTIQAAFVLAELARRTESFRGLVVAPAGLREQWSSELATRFSLEATVADARWLDRLGRDLPPEVNPWILPGLYLTSFDFIKRPEVLQSLETLPWDIVVIDEAHNASLGTARRAAVDAVSMRSRRVLLLTATPHAGDDEQFGALCRLGVPDDKSPPVLVFQRSRADVGVAVVRRTTVLPVRLTGTERRMHRLLDEYTSRVCREAAARDDPHARLAAIVLKKRALSSAGSLAASARRRLTLLASVPITPTDYQLRLPLGPERGAADDLEDAAPDHELRAPGLSNAARERRWVAAILECAENASRGESKTCRLLRFLDRMHEPAIVFTEFRDTLERLHAVVRAAGHDVWLLHGGLSGGERLKALQAFNEYGGILLATDAASEGLNLQKGCRAVVHYELPWSPARLEQRTGRVDRIGQGRRVHELLLVADDTAERLVLAPLAGRAARARSAGPFFPRLLDVLTESRVATAVMQGTPFDVLRLADVPAPVVHQALPAPAALRHEAATEAARLRQQRTWLSSFRAQPRSRALVATTVRLRKKRTMAEGVCCVYTLSLCTPAGTVIHCQIACARKDFPKNTDGRRAAHLRRLVQDVMNEHEPVLRAAVVAAHKDALAEAASTHAQAVDTLERREQVISASLRSTARELVQVGLFDVRELKASDARRRTTGALIEASQEHLRSLTESRTIVTNLELTAILFVAG